MTSIGGTWYVMPTTFDESGALDLTSQRSLAEAVVDWGVDGITLLGVMGEASALASDERELVLTAVTEAVNGKVPIAVGCSGAAPYAVAALCDQAREHGAGFAMVSAPPLLRNADSLPTFFRRICERTQIPLILQDEPAATGTLVSAKVWAECLAESGSSYLKLEDPPTATKISALLQRAPEAKIFGGLGGLASYYELLRGAVGTMTGFSYPEILRAIRIALASGDRADAFRIYARFLPLVAIEATPIVGLSIRKELLRRRGVIRNATARVGPEQASAVLCDELDEVLRELAIEPSAKPLVID
ncbi:MAG: 4-hydroxy-tetrahydrodipicolinate synthase [Mycobacterium sp.]|jgi:4-hydroxy-tetrahydrodipicolinate synthase|uniref:dihydrodipicolinate synthase family protein n=1 Tax=Mycobacterium sp. TaxID=1785 RepID=UPI0028B52D81|nr:dihydrodipicolinate synthase family protein [Mycobacterium sp.]MDT5120387.1 4-hydroxy-tetrahydrodipicolinate synthase [Mycobacterium sp.]